MPAPRLFFRQSMTARLLMLCLLNMLVFATVIFIMISAFTRINGLTSTIITRDVDRIIQNGQMARDLAGILTETNLLVSTFYGRDEVLKKQKELLTHATDFILAGEMAEPQRDILKDFRTALSLLLQQCATINNLHDRIMETDGNLHAAMTRLEETVSNKIVEQVLAGDDSMAYEQIGALIPSYRESLLHTTLLFGGLEPAREDVDDIFAITELLNNLDLRLKTLLASDAEVAAYGRQLLGGVLLYRHAITDFQQERHQFNKRLAVLDEAKGRTMAAMKGTDNESVEAAQSMKKEITDTTGRTVDSVLSISVLVVIALGVFTYVFFLRHIRRPIEAILRGIVSVSKGDLQTRIVMGRKDEWNVIENALNSMIHDLGESYAALQKNNRELTETQSQMAQNMIALESEMLQREQAEKETERLQQQLQHAQKMEAIGTLAGGVAHDFNNLLQGIQGYSELLLLKAGDHSSRELQEILRAAKRGGELTRQLLTFSRKVDSNLCPVDLNQVISDLLDLLERTIPKMIKVTLHLKGNLSFVNADAVQLEQVLMNLAVNARDAMPDGGRLTIGTEETVLDHKYDGILPEIAPGPYVLLTVSDTGQGMDRETQNRIFDPFFTTKSIGKGTGLGMAIVYGIVKNHQGHISCYSEPAKGTTFKIYLPAIDREKPALADKEEEDQPRGTETILLVDDESFIRDIGRQILSQFGYTVLSAEDGESALQIYEREKNRIDLIILDIIMPGMGGEQCLKRLMAEHAPAKIIIASGYSARGPLGDIIHGGAHAFITKPYDVGRFLRTVRRVLDGQVVDDETEDDPHLPSPP